MKAHTKECHILPHFYIVQHKLHLEQFDRSSCHAVINASSVRLCVHDCLSSWRWNICIDQCFYSDSAIFAKIPIR